MARPPHMPLMILALGEVLWDVFPDGPRFGGAPANFACACAGLGGDRVRVSLVSAVGRDPLGDQALVRLDDHRIDTSLITRSDSQTGQVLVSLDALGQPTYEFIDDPAWDHLTDSESLRTAARIADVVHFSTLGQRAPKSRVAIRRAVESARPECLRIFDLNLRPPFGTPEIVRDSLAQADVLKLNDVELPVLAGILSLSGPVRDVLSAVRTAYGLRLIALTRGADGSLLLSADGFDDRPGRAVDVVDTVGAGDAFTAALALGLSEGWALDRINHWAGTVAEYVCTRPGATPEIPMELRLRPARSAQSGNGSHSCNER